MTNREFSEQPDFQQKCAAFMGERKHGHLSLARQASKYRRKTGIVYQKEHEKQ